MLVRKSSERGKNKIDWLNANHTFSFGQYFDPKWTHFHKLLVINEDTIAAKMGFGTHPHKNMEIITYVIEGEIKHQDSMGSLGLITPGEIQVMSAGTGVAHSEHNNLEAKSTHLLQIWIMPSRDNLIPRYAQQRVFGPNEQNFFKIIAGTQKDDVGIKLNADALIWLGKYSQEASVNFSPLHFNNYWIQIVKGGLKINGQVFEKGDGIAFSSGERIEINTTENGAEFLILEIAD
jgi:quercetin 2,3-dioxygenase